MAADLKPLPTLEPEHPLLRQYECPVCLIYKHHHSVLHTGCMRVLCIHCVIHVLDNGTWNSPCPFCGIPIQGRTSDLDLIKLPPNDQAFMDSVRFRCGSCDQLCTESEAYDHPNNCPEEPIHQPPTHIHTRGRAPVAQVEVVSHPIYSVRPQIRRQRPVINFVNGRQHLSRVLNSSTTIREIQRLVARNACLDDVVETYQYKHRLLPPDETLGQNAPALGATYLMHYSTEQNLKEVTAYLNFREAGPPLHIPQPDEIWP